MRDRHAVRRTRADGRQRRHVPLRHEDGRPQDGHDGDVHAEADLRRQRERDACPPEPLDERQEHDVRPEGRVRGDQPDVPVLHRRVDGTRPQPVRVHEPDDELVPPARPGLRGARVHRLVQTQPEREHPDSDVLPGHRGGEAHRVSDAGPGLQPVPVLRRNVVRGPRRRQEEDRSGQPRRRGSLSSQREQAQGVRRPRAAGIPEGVDRAPADRLHVPQDGLPAGPPRKVRGAEARRAPADLAAALAVRVLPVHGRLNQAGFADSLAQMISDAGQGQPSWLQPWFAFWSQTVGANPGFFITTIGALELALGFALLLGFMRKVAYTAGIFLSLIIWSVPEGFGGPYGPSSTDIGTGIIYAIVFLLLMIINAAFGPSRWSLDYAIERRWPAWKKVSEIRSAA